jgi:hypothetical protein
MGGVGSGWSRAACSVTYLVLGLSLHPAPRSRIQQPDSPPCCDWPLEELGAPGPIIQSARRTALGDWDAMASETAASVPQQNPDTALRDRISLQARTARCFWQSSRGWTEREDHRRRHESLGPVSEGEHAW